MYGFVLASPACACQRQAHKQRNFICIYICLAAFCTESMEEEEEVCSRGGVGWGHISPLSLSLSLLSLSLTYTRARALYLSRALPWGFSEANACRKDRCVTTTRLRRAFTIYSQKFGLEIQGILQPISVATHLCNTLLSLCSDASLQHRPLCCDASLQYRPLCCDPSLQHRPRSLRLH